MGAFHTFCNAFAMLGMIFHRAAGCFHYMYRRRITDMTRFQLMVPLEAHDVLTNLADHWMHLEVLQIS